MRVRLLVAIVLAALQLSVNAAQPGDLAGTWAVDVKGVEVQTSDGVNWKLVPISGTLTLQQKDDAVTGTWQGRMPDPWKLTGTTQKGSFELQTEVRNLPVERDGHKGTIARSWIFRGTRDGDKLSGMFILAGGDGEPPAQPFTAARKK